LYRCLRRLTCAFVAFVAFVALLYSDPETAQSAALSSALLKLTLLRRKNTLFKSTVRTSCSEQPTLQPRR
jgi:hypothetical protein